MAVKLRLTPTLFDKLVGDLTMSGLREEEKTPEISLDGLRNYQVPRLDRFNEAALRSTLRREVAWLLNTTNLAASVDLTDFPEVASSVLNYGVPDLAGKSLHHRSIQHRAREIRTALRAFEPRLEPDTVRVEPVAADDDLNRVNFLIHGDISSAVQVMPLKLKTSIEVDSAAVDVRE
ncbi:MAG TPA: type VI secretion system baseplate subunit TssE [Allosphingosinicella sp.]|jgi:type VI secretion system protein ImpF